MGNGLKKVAKQCGGIIVTSGGHTTRYDANGVKIDVKGKAKAKKETGK